MREIKFRAWHEKWNRLIYEIYLGDNEVKFPIGNTNDILDINEEYSNLIFQQYTGLKDKNGREIYEGDIVRNHRSTSNELLEVLWQEEVAQHASDGIYWTKEVPGFRFKRIKRGLTTVFVAHVDLEVIGNVYKDPELLEAAE
ncbi:YopX family protein [Bacillus atrophaeus]|uniref:YopX family protein n=1 Tax=Bacillus atrophaeus TaxID=1452 RepID=UPI002DBB0FFB|nr:YopX family protein [Bacillus atrophaeus]MEC0765060.1 YopX family protein [Bacillus atrophaeus]MEC0778269.1 YopX family protein [Bacillus atrophaeus]MEC0808305.1 YopX family protein [Bacillus atrophaeus]